MPVAFYITVHNRAGLIPAKVRQYILSLVESTCRSQELFHPGSLLTDGSLNSNSPRTGTGTATLLPGIIALPEWKFDNGVRTARF